LLDYLRSPEWDGRANRGFRPDLDVELADLAWPRWSSPAPSTKQLAAGVYFDVRAVDRFLRFCAKLRHIKGRTFAGRRFIPDVWQIVFVIAPLFGWKKPDGTRLYRVLYLEVPRKNGKSTLCAAIALYLLSADGEPGAEIYSAAKDRDQARAVFDVAARMVWNSPALAKRLTALIPSRIIRYEATASVYKAMSSDSGGASKHGLNVHGVIVDELHVIVDAGLIETYETGTGSREQPVVAFITTAGIPGESPVWEDKRATAVSIAEGTASMDDELVVIYAADPKCAIDGTWRDEAVWKAANPGYGKSLMPAFMARQARAAEIAPASLNGFLRLHLDVPTESVSGWIELGRWDASASIVDELDLRGARCYGGLDLASSLDLAALALVFPDEADEVVDIVMRFWTPGATMRKRGHLDHVDYEAWARDGWIHATPGETINYDAVELDIVTACDLFDVRSIDFDPWGSKQLVTHLEDKGVPMHQLRQGYASLSPPMKELTKLVVERRARHGGNPVLRWNVAGTQVASDPAGNIKPDRKRSRNRIDGVAALVNGVGGWLRAVGKGRSVYEDRDVEVVGR